MSATRMMNENEALAVLAKPGVMDGFLSVDGEVNSAILTLGRAYLNGYRMKPPLDHGKNDQDFLYKVQNVDFLTREK